MNPQKKSNSFSLWTKGHEDIIAVIDSIRGDESLGGAMIKLLAYMAENKNTAQEIIKQPITKLSVIV